MMKTVSELRAEGCTVRCIHIRKFKDGEFATKHERLERGLGYSDFVQPRGGETEVHIRFPDGKELKEYSICSSLDNYNKKIGVRICIGRIMKNQEKNT